MVVFWPEIVSPKCILLLHHQLSFVSGKTRSRRRRGGSSAMDERPCALDLGEWRLRERGVEKKTIQISEGQMQAQRCHMHNTTARRTGD
eukprot:2969213-Rhodomonas_salina.2